MHVARGAARGGARAHVLLDRELRLRLLRERRLARLRLSGRLQRLPLLGERFAQHVGRGFARELGRRRRGGADARVAELGRVVRVAERAAAPLARHQLDDEVGHVRLAGREQDRHVKRRLPAPSRAAALLPVAVLPRGVRAALVRAGRPVGLRLRRAARAARAAEDRDAELAQRALVVQVEAVLEQRGDRLDHLVVGEPLIGGRIDRAADVLEDRLVQPCAFQPAL